MPVVIPLTNADHGGVRAACATHNDHAACGGNCDCGCPYSGLHHRVEGIAEIERRYPNQWLGLVIPAGEDDYAPEYAMLVVHSDNDNEVWDAVQSITFNQVVHVYFNGDLDAYLTWAERS